MDDIMVKSKRRVEHFHVLRKLFEEMLSFQTENEPSRVCIQGVLWEIPGFLGSQQRNRCGPSQSYGHSNYKTSSHSKRVEEFLGEGLII